MLLTLGQARGGTDVIAALLECHERIRRFTALAVRLSTALDQPAADVADTAAQVRRYFAEALPLHVADEDVDLTAALAGRDAEVDAALATMSGEHRGHEPALARLVELCGAIAAEPAALAARAAELGEVSARLEVELGAHLELEERVLIPALRALPEKVRATLHAAIRRRRGAPA